MLNNLLKKINLLAEDSSGTEYLTFYVDRYKDQFNTSSLPIKNKLKKKIRFTLDTMQDFKIISKFLESMKKKHKLLNYKIADIINFYLANKTLFKIK